MRYIVGVAITVSFLLNVVFSVLVQDLALSVEVLAIQSASHKHTAATHRYRLDTYDGRVASLRTDVALLTTHCEIAMDIGVSTARGGWWDRRVAEELRMLQQIKTLREENKHNEREESRRAVPSSVP